MSIQAIKEQFHNGQISKKVFIDLMHDKYKALFDFSKNFENDRFQPVFLLLSA